MIKTTFAAALLGAGLAIALPSTAPAQSTDAATDAPTEAPAQVEITGVASEGEKLYRRNCRACHGANGKGASSYPRLVGLDYGYMVDIIARYRDGERFGPNTALMAQRVNRLSDQDIADAAAFILTLEDN